MPLSESITKYGKFSWPQFEHFCITAFFNVRLQIFTHFYLMNVATMYSKEMMQNHPAFKVNNSKKTPQSKITTTTTTIIVCSTQLFTSLLLRYYGHYFSAFSVTYIIHKQQFFSMSDFCHSKHNF